MTSRSEGAWDRAAQGYARQEHLELQAVRRALDFTQPRFDERLLDVATGTGIVLRELARRSTRPAEAVGVDTSPAMLARLGALPTGWHAQHGDATRLPFASASFDVATVAYLLQLLDAADRGAALAELHRVVRPAGRLVLVTVWSARPAARAALDGLARVAPATSAGLRTHDPRAELARAGWRLERAAALHHGYPSLVVLARRVALSQAGSSPPRASRKAE